MTAAGIPEFFNTMADKRAEYEKEYKPELERRIRERAEEKKTEGLDKLMNDMNVGSKRQHRNISRLAITYSKNQYISTLFQMERTRTRMMDTLSILILWTTMMTDCKRNLCRQLGMHS